MSRLVIVATLLFGIILYILCSGQSTWMQVNMPQPTAVPRSPAVTCFGDCCSELSTSNSSTAVCSVHGGTCTCTLLDSQVFTVPVRRWNSSTKQPPRPRCSWGFGRIRSYYKHPDELLWPGPDEHTALKDTLHLNSCSFADTHSKSDSAGQPKQFDEFFLFISLSRCTNESLFAAQNANHTLLIEHDLEGLDFNSCTTFLSAELNSFKDVYFISASHIQHLKLTLHAIAPHNPPERLYEVVRFFKILAVVDFLFVRDFPFPLITNFNAYYMEAWSAMFPGRVYFQEHCIIRCHEDFVHNLIEPKVKSLKKKFDPFFCLIF